MILHIATHALSDNNQQFFNFLLKLTKKQLKKPWILSNREQADAILVDVDQPEGRKFWENYQEKGKLVAFSWLNAYKAGLFLPKPLREIQPLIELLDRLAETHNDNPAKGAQTANKTSSATPIAVFEPEHYLLGLLQDALKTGQPRRFSCGDLPPLYILPAHQQCFMAPTDIKQLKLFCGVRASDIESTPLSETELFQAVQTQHLRMYRMETVLWFSALYASHGRLITGYTKEMPISLKSWPNFTKLPYQSVHMDLAALMVRQPMDLTAIATTKKVPLSTVVDFFNACVALGLVKISPQSSFTTVTRSSTVSKPGLFKNILQRLCLVN
jgi:hypothetical protein